MSCGQGCYYVGPRFGSLTFQLISKGEGYLNREGRLAVSSIADTMAI